MAKKTTFSVNAAVWFSVYDHAAYIWRGLAAVEAMERIEVKRLSLLLLAKPTVSGHVGGELYARLFNVAMEKELLVSDVARAALAVGIGVDRVVEILRRSRAAPPRVPRRLSDVEKDVLEMLGVI